MLASTVQFSNNDQPPITPPAKPVSALGPATEEKIIPSDTQQRARHDQPTRSAFHAPKSSTNAWSILNRAE